MSSALFGRRLGLQWGDPQASLLQNRSNLFLDTFFSVQIGCESAGSIQKVFLGHKYLLYLTGNIWRFMDI